MTRVIEFKNLEEKPDASYRGSVHDLLGSPDVKKELETLLQYEGVEQVKISGNFLSGLPEITKLSVDQIATILGMSKSTYYRSIQSTKLNDDTVDKIASLLKIYARGVMAFRGDFKQFEEWLITKIPNLKHQKPITLMNTENGRMTLLQTLDRIRYNVYG